MNGWDKVIPHRRAISRSLRKEAEKLVSHIDEYKEQYEQQFRKSQEELDQTAKRLNDEYESTRQDFLDQLATASCALQEIANSVIEYAAAFYNRMLADKKAELNNMQKSIIAECIGFLSAHMHEIGNEIELLRQRKSLLEQRACVDDIVHLIELSGYALAVNEASNAPELLALVKNQMDSVKENNDIQWYALRNIENMLRERIAFSAEVQYISWIIEQKIQLSKELKLYRSEQRTLLKANQAEAGQILNEKQNLDNELMALSRSIRFYWAKSIIMTGADISERYAEKELCYANKGDAEDGLQHMREMRSKDQDKWERLQREKKESLERIDTLKREITHLKAKRKSAISDRKLLFEYFEKKNIALKQIARRGQKDEEFYADVRLRELNEIDRQGIEEAERKYQEEYNLLNAERDNAINLLDQILGSRKEEYSSVQREFAAAEKDLKSIQDSDHRFILIKWFKDTDEETKAKYRIEFLKSRVAQASNSLLSAQRNRDEQDKEYALRLHRLSPRQMRPTGEERTEMKKIQIWQANQEEYRNRERM